MSEADFATSMEELESIAVSAQPSYVLEESDRITARLDFYYERFNEDPVYSSHVLESLIPQSEEEVYKRKATIEEEWTSIDTGWLESISYILIKNYKKSFSIHPTEQERQDENQKFILIRYDEGDPIFQIDKGSFLLFKPIDINKLQISSPNGTTKVELIVMPSR